jgi:hypothetical protein
VAAGRGGLPRADAGTGMAAHVMTKSINTSWP